MDDPSTSEITRAVKDCSVSEQTMERLFSEEEIVQKNQHRNNVYTEMDSAKERLCENQPQPSTDCSLSKTFLERMFSEDAAKDSSNTAKECSTAPKECSTTAKESSLSEPALINVFDDTQNGAIDSGNNDSTQDMFLNVSESASNEVFDEPSKFIIPKICS